MFSYHFPNIVYLLAAGFCHQQGAHSFFIEGESLPFCARCTGLYLGYFLAFLYGLISWRSTRLTSPRVAILLLFYLFIVYFVFDALASLFISPDFVNNFTRLLSGLLFGLSIGIIILMAIKFSFRKNNKNQTNLIGIGGLVILVLAAIIIFLGFYYNIKEIMYLAGFLSVAGFLAFLVSFNFLILSIFPKFPRKLASQRGKYELIGYSFLAMAAEIIFFSVIRNLADLYLL